MAFSLWGKLSQNFSKLPEKARREWLLHLYRCIRFLEIKEKGKTVSRIL